MDGSYTATVLPDHCGAMTGNANSNACGYDNGGSYGADRFCTGLNDADLYDAGPYDAGPSDGRDLDNSDHDHGHGRLCGGRVCDHRSGHPDGRAAVLCRGKQIGLVAERMSGLRDVWVDLHGAFLDDGPGDLRLAQPGDERADPLWVYHDGHDDLRVAFQDADPGFRRAGSHDAGLYGQLLGRVGRVGTIGPHRDWGGHRGGFGQNQCVLLF